MIRALACIAAASKVRCFAVCVWESHNQASVVFAAVSFLLLWAADLVPVEAVPEAEPALAAVNGRTGDGAKSLGFFA